MNIHEEFEFYINNRIRVENLMRQKYSIFYYLMGEERRYNIRNKMMNKLYALEEKSE